jgi:CPA2 family monovalent cation:H+ antiporter-2
LVWFRHWVETTQTKSVYESTSIGLQSILLTSRSGLAGKAIRECGLREMINGIIVGVARKHQRILNPGSDFVLNEGDLVWVVVHLDLIGRLKAL